MPTAPSFCARIGILVKKWNGVCFRLNRKKVIWEPFQFEQIVVTFGKWIGMRSIHDSRLSTLTSYYLSKNSLISQRTKQLYNREPNFSSCFSKIYAPDWSRLHPVSRTVMPFASMKPSL